MAATEQRLKKLTKEIIKRQEGLEGASERRNMETVTEEIAKYVLPRRELHYRKNSTSKGAEVGKYVFDPTAIIANRTHAEGMQGHLVSPRSKWFRRKTNITANGVQIDELPDVRSWLQDVEREEYNALQRSNFYQAATEFFLDAGSLGTAIMYAEYDWDNDRPVFMTRHPAECYLSENSQGVVDTVFRKFKLTARVAVDRFDITDQQTVQMAERSPDKELEFIHAVYPRESRDVTKLLNTDKRFASIYVQMTGGDGPAIVRESGYDLFPYAIWRYYKEAGEVYGRSPAWDLLETIKLLNKMGKAMIMATQLAVDPPWALPERWKGSFKNQPGAKMYYESDQKQIGYPMVGSLNGIPVTLEHIQHLQQQIEEGYKVTFFAMLANQDKQMTATEIMERQGEKATLLGPAIGRLNAEALTPLMDLLNNMMLEAGKIPPPPQTLEQHAGADIAIDFVGPLAQAQEMYLGSQPIKRWLETMLPYAQFFPDMIDNVNADEVAQELALAAGVPQSVMRSRQELQQMRAQRAQQQQAMMQMQGQAAQADVYNKTKDAPEQGSAAEALLNPAAAIAGQTG